MKLIVVASTNPVKINCIKQAYEAMFPGTEFVIEGLDSPSGVPDQPFGAEQTLTGARNRARFARTQKPEADYVVGIEGGLLTDDLGQLTVVAWFVIINKAGLESQASTGTFVLPKSIADDVRSGMELGSAADKMHGTTNIKQAGGTVGILTGGAMDRTAYYVHAAILAFIPFKNPELYH